MSGPYDQYNYNSQQHPQQYPQQPGYGSPPPQQPYGYPPQQQPYPNPNVGPPAQGGFPHGGAGNQYGAYDASIPHGHAGYYGTPPPPAAPSDAANDAFLQNQAYQASMSAPKPPHSRGHSPQPGHHQPYPDSSQQEFARQSSDANAPNYDPNAPPMGEGERGLMGSIGGGVAGHLLGKKAGHGFLGTAGGAILGSLAEDFLKKEKKHEHHSGSSHSGSHGHHHHHHSHHSQSSGDGGKY